MVSLVEGYTRACTDFHRNANGYRGIQACCSAKQENLFPQQTSGEVRNHFFKFETDKKETLCSPPASAHMHEALPPPTRIEQKATSCEMSMGFQTKYTNSVYPWGNESTMEHTVHCAWLDYIDVI